MSLKEQKDSILNEALRIFGRFGFTKTTMSDIANAAKKGRRTIYTYFKSKEEIFNAVIEREIEKIVISLQEIVKSDLLPPQKLHSYFFKRMTCIYELANFNEALRKDFLGDYQRVEIIRKNLDKQELMLIEKMINEGVSKNYFHASNVVSISESLFYANKGLEIKFIRQNFNDDCKTQLKEFLETLFNGLLKTK